MVETEDESAAVVETEDESAAVVEPEDESEAVVETLDENASGSFEDTDGAEKKTETISLEQKKTL